MRPLPAALRRMSNFWTRRAVLHGLAALVPACASGVRPSPASPPRAEPRTLSGIEAAVGGRVGVFAVDTGSGRMVAHRQDERFAMCSTFKWALAAAVLLRVDRGELSLDERVAYDTSDLLDHAPVTAARVAEGSLTVEVLAHAAVTVSDNPAANLLLGTVGGPAGLTATLRGLGDPVTRLDRYELALNDNIPGDPRDTTSPRAMVTLMREVLCGDALTPASKARLLGWLCACETGKDRLRAGLPKDWTVGDKTGTGMRGAVHDVAIAWPPGRAPILIAAYMSDGEAGRARLVAAHEAVGRLVAAELG